MRNMSYIFILFFGLLISCAVISGNENPSNPDPDNLVFEVNQLKDTIQKMEQGYKDRIDAIEKQIARPPEVYVREAEDKQLSPFYGTRGSLMNPDISILADAIYHFSDQSEGVGEFADDELFFREVEMAFQGYIYPGVRAEFFPTFEVEEGHVEIEEAFANFLTLPFNASLLVGRQRVRFGLVNPRHQEFQDWVDTPLAVQNFLGDEAYIDDGIDLSLLAYHSGIPITVGFGVFDGDKSLAEGDEHEEEEDEEGDDGTLNIFESMPVEWKDHVFLAKVNANIPISINYSDASLGYHILWDDNGGGNTVIHNGQFSLRYRFPYSYRNLLWQNELYVADIDDRDVKSTGLYSFIRFRATRFLDAGVRYDWSELGDNDNAHHWAINPIFTWRLTDRSYVRIQYRYVELEGVSSANEGLIQFVWGIGPHLHGITD